MPQEKVPVTPKRAKSGASSGELEVRWGFGAAGEPPYFGRVEGLMAYRQTIRGREGGTGGGTLPGADRVERLLGGGTHEVLWGGPELRDEKGRPLRLVVIPSGSGTEQEKFGVIQAGPGQIHERWSNDPLVEEAVAAVLERVPEIVRARREKLSEEHIVLLVDAYLKSAPTAQARHAIELDNARERARFREEFPCYTSRELAELAGHGAGNVSATATRWKKARRIIGLPWKDGDLYPAFQFSEGRPKPIIARLLAALPERMSPWQIAFWLTSSNSWLGGAAPLDRLEDEEAVLAAAARESEALGG